MTVRKIIQIGHPALKAKNEIIADFNSPKLKRLIKDLKDTMHKTGLIGIAAPQIARNYLVFVTQPRKTKTRKLTKIDKFRVYINPKIVFYAKDTSLIYEGCGSVARGNLFGPVIRPKEIRIEAYDENGTKYSLECDGILARVIQHEYDHLFGIEFLEKISDYRQIISAEYYRQSLRNSKEQKQASKITKIIYHTYGILDQWQKK